MMCGRIFFFFGRDLSTVGWLGGWLIVTPDRRRGSQPFCGSSKEEEEEEEEDEEEEEEE